MRREFGAIAGGIARKSDSYIFAIEHNSIPITLKSSCVGAEFGLSEDGQQEEDQKRLLMVIPARRKLITPDQIEFYRANWSRIRWFLYSTFWLGWIFSVIAAVLLAASHQQKCVLTTREWWKDSIIYEVWTLSYGDSNRDDVGDLEGLRRGLANLGRLGIGAALLGPVLRVEKSGLGLIDLHNQQSGQIGTADDFGKLVEEARRLGLRVLIDFPLVVASTAHPWFDRSALAARPENFAFADFFYWRRGPIPNNKTEEFISAYHGSTLKYFHVKGRPDLPVLKWANANVSESIKDALSFWLGRGADGFHLSSIDYLHRSPDGRQPEWAEIGKILRSIRTHLDGQVAGTDRQIFLFAAHEHLSEATKRRLVEEGGLDTVVNTELRKLAIGNRICSKQEASLAECANEIVADLLLFHQQKRRRGGGHGPSPSSSSVWPVWSLGSPFTQRLASRLHGQRAMAELLVMLELVLPGTPMVYYGEERGQRNCHCHGCKYPQRGPLGGPEIPEEEEWASSNSSTPFNPFGPDDFLRNFHRIARLRQRSKTLASGEAYITKPQGQQAFALCRYLQNEEEEGEEEGHFAVFGQVLIFAANFGPVEQSLSLADLPPLHGQPRSVRAKVLARSVGARHSFPLNSAVDLDWKERALAMGPVQAVILQVDASGGGSSF